MTNEAILSSDDRREKIHAIVAKWEDDDRIPLSFDDWQPVVIEQNDLEEWVSFNITDYLDWCIGMDLFTTKEVAIAKGILKEVKEIMA